jgi:hypothetical protein
MVLLITYFILGLVWSVFGLLSWLKYHATEPALIDLIIVPCVILIHWLAWPYMLWLVLSEPDKGTVFRK